MWRKIFSQNSPYTNRARMLAVSWTLLIFFLCFIPGSELPDVQIPFVDKWAHLVLFGIFSFLWLCTAPTDDWRWLLIVFIVTIFLGWLVEYIQGHFVTGRTQDNMDTIADTVGGGMGIALFVAVYKLLNSKAATTERH